MKLSEDDLAEVLPIRYKADYSVNTEPMALGEYCEKYFTTNLPGRRLKEPGYKIIYDFIDPVTQEPYIGWMSEDLFNKTFKEADMKINELKELQAILVAAILIILITLAVI